MSHPFAGYASFVLLLGDAHRTATLEQRQALRDSVMPLLDEFRDRSTSPARVRQLPELILNEALRIMGPDWRLSGEANQMIEALLGGRS